MQDQFCYRNYLKTFNHKSIQLDNLLENASDIEAFTNIYQNIIDKNLYHIRALSIDDNNRQRIIAISDIKNMCTALEIECDKSLKKTRQQKLIAELKEELKKTIKEFEKVNPIKVHDETTYSTCFKHLNYTLKDRIFQLYEFYIDEMENILKYLNLSLLEKSKIAKFVNLRNMATHSLKSQWNGGEKIFLPLWILVYVSFFRRMGYSKEKVIELCKQLF